MFVSLELMAGASAPPVVHYFADIPHTFSPSDANHPNRHFEGRAKVPLVIERTLPFLPTADRRAVLQIGDIVLSNPDFALDETLDLPIDGRSVHVLSGRRSAAFSSFKTLFKGTAVGWRSVTDRDIALSLRDAVWEMERPVPRNTYSGAGGSPTTDGGADLKGKKRPRGWGIIRNIPLVLVDAANKIYQANDGVTSNVLGVFDGGYAFTPEGDVADIKATTVSSGNYKTQLSGGYIRLGSAPAKPVTADIQGDVTDGLYSAKVADIAYRIAAGADGFDVSKIQIETLDNVRASATGDVGLWIGTEETTSDALLTELMAKVDGWWGPNQAGLVEFGICGLPAAAARCSLKEYHILNFQWLEMPEIVSPCIWKCKVGYQRNYFPMDESQIATAIITSDPTRLQFLKNEWRFTAETSDSLVLQRHPRAKELVFLSAYDNEADAIALRDRLFTRWKTPRNLARLYLRQQGWEIPLGATTNVTFPRRDLVGGKNVLVVGQGIDAAPGRSTLDIFW